MAKISYIKKNYPIALMKQLNVPEVINSDDIYIEAQEWSEVSELNKMLEKLEDSDTLTLYSIQTLFCVKGHLNLFLVLRNKNIRLVSVLEKIDTKEDSYFYTHVINVLEIQNQCRSDHSKISVKLRKEKGMAIGRPKVSDKTIKEIQILRWREKKSYRDISRECDVALGTVQKYANDKVLERVFS